MAVTIVRDGYFKSAAPVPPERRMAQSRFCCGYVHQSLEWSAEEVPNSVAAVFNPSYS